MESTSRPYRYRSNPLQRALFAAHAEASERAEMASLDVRDAIAPLHMRHLERAAAACGLI